MRLHNFMRITCFNFVQYSCRSRHVCLFLAAKPCQSPIRSMPRRPSPRHYGGMKLHPERIVSSLRQQLTSTKTSALSAFWNTGHHTVRGVWTTMMSEHRIPVKARAMSIVSYYLALTRSSKTTTNPILSTASNAHCTLSIHRAWPIPCSGKVRVR